MGSLEDMQHIRYHCEHDEVTAVCKQTDELMIANMINILNNPTLWEILTDSEKYLVTSVVRDHIVFKAKLARDIQDEFIRTSDNKKLF